MQDDPVFQYIKLFVENISLWELIALGLLIWLLRHPEKLKALPRYIASARFGGIEVDLRALEQKLEETESHVAELEEENIRLSSLYEAFNPNAPADELEATRQSLKAMAASMTDTTPILDGLKPGAKAADVYAAAVLLRSRRDISRFDALIDAVERIAAHAKLEGLRYHTVWTLASAVHLTVISAVKHTVVPKLTEAQLQKAQHAMTLLLNNSHVRQDCPDDPKSGITGPATYALNWIGTGLEKYHK